MIIFKILAVGASILGMMILMVAILWGSLAGGYYLITEYPVLGSIMVFIVLSLVIGFTATEGYYD